MLSSTAILIIIFSVVAVVGFSILGWQSYKARARYNGRELVTTHQFYVDCSFSDSVSENCLAEVLDKIARAFRLNPGKLRPDDKFSELTVLDSWNYGSGIADLEDILKEKNCDIEASQKILTVRDFIIWYCKHEAS